MRGEKFTTCTAMLTIRGSPPRARGEVRIPRRMAGPARITPACAGRSRRALPGSHRRAGSPPRARGEVRNLRHRVVPAGITPACAGRSWPRSRGRARSWDHPRVRGEKMWGHKFFPPSRGSPPRARGEVVREPRFAPHERITPACAGRRGCRSSPCRPCGDHPRVRGEKLS